MKNHATYLKAAQPLSHHTIASDIANLVITNTRPNQGTFNFGILVSRVGGSGDPRRKWEEMGGQERAREREGGREGGRKVLLLFAKWSKRTIEMQEVYILPLKKPTAFIAIIKKFECTL